MSTKPRPSHRSAAQSTAGASGRLANRPPSPDAIASPPARLDPSAAKSTLAPRSADSGVASALVDIAARLRDRTRRLAFADPVAFVYRPLDYAWSAHEQFTRKYGGLGARVLLVGMNPGPWGMAQTGVPFGEVAAVRDWLAIDAEIKRPSKEHPKRPVEGLACRRNEVSGARLWGWAADRFGAPESFFSRYFVANFCPLCFMEESGRNRTPDKLPAAEREPLFAACEEALREMCEVLRPELVVGVGAFAEARARAAVEKMRAVAGKYAGATSESPIRIGRMPHPSPASPAANRGWAKQADAALKALGCA